MSLEDIEVNYGNGFHLAGIIPVAGQPMDFNMPWHDCLMPIGHNYLAIERSIYECSVAGCETIWIVCHREMQPLLRERIGDWVHDVAFLPSSRKYWTPFPSEQERQIPIYYVPIHPKDRDRRDCLAWSVIYGSLRAFHVSKMISRWTVPDKYYVSFPWGTYPVGGLRKRRDLISCKNNFYIQYDGKTVRDGEYLGFTFGKEEFKAFRHVIRDEGTGHFKPGSYYTKEGGFVGEALPINERWSARNFPLDKVFGCVTMDGSAVLDLPWYYRIDSWSNYHNYMSSPQSKLVKKPTYIKYHEWSPVGVDNEDLEDV